MDKLPKPEELLPYQDAVETALGIPLLPQTPYELHKPERGLYDIRQTVHRIVMGGISRLMESSDIPPPQEGALWTPSSAVLATYMSESRQSLKILRGQVAVANNLVDARANPPSLPEGLLDPNSPRGKIQQQIEDRLFAFAQRPDYRPSHWHRGTMDELRGGLAVISATSTGKTVPMAKFMLHAGVGRPVSSSHPDETIRALLVDPSQALLKEHRDPNKILRRILGCDVSVSDFFQFSKKSGGALHVNLADSVPRALAEGILNPDDYAIRFIDEGHHFFQPRIRLLVKELGAHIFLMTATPAYSQDKDLRRFFVSYTASRLREASEKGAVGRSKLFTYQYDDDPVELATQLASGYIKQGAQVAVYCRPKGGAEQAKAISQKLNGKTEEGVEPLAAAFGWFNSYAQNNREEASFRSGKRRALVATQMFTEGVNMPIDVLIVIGPRYSQLKFDQIVGRGPRDPDSTTIIIELQPRNLIAGTAPLASLWRSFDLEYVEQGRVIGPPNEEGFYEPSGQPSSPARNRRTGSKQGFESNTGFDIPDDLAEFLAPPQPLRTLLVAPQDLLRLEAPPRGATGSFALAEKYDVPVQWIEYTYEQQSVPYEGFWRVEEDGSQIIERYYRESLDWRKLIKDAQVGRREIGAMCGVSLKVVDRILPGLDLPDGKEYGMPAIKTIVEAILAIETASDTDIAVVDLSTELDENFVYSFVNTARHNIEQVGKWRNSDLGVSGFALHINGKDADRVREAYYSRDERTATGTHMSFTEIASSAGVSLRTILDYFENPPEGVELPRVFRLRKGVRRQEGKSIVSGREGQYVLRDEGVAIADRFRPKKLSPYRVTLPMMEGYFAVSHRRVITAKIAELRVELGDAESDQAIFAPETVRLGGHGANTHAYRWDVMELLEAAGLKPRDPEARIDYGRIAKAKGVGNTRYTQEVQGRLIDPKKLEIIDVAQEDVETKEEQISEQPAAQEPEEPSQAWVSLDDAIQRLGTQHHAFFALMRLVGLTETSLERDDNGDVTAVMFTAIELMEDYSIGGAPVHGWMRLNGIARTVSHTSDEAYQKLLDIERAYGRPFNAAEMRLGRSESEVEIFVVENIGKQIQRELRQAGTGMPPSFRYASVRSSRGWKL